MRCDQCQFFSFPFSECRASPPVALAVDVSGVFPMIAPDAWCGRFKSDHDVVQAVALRAMTRKHGTTEYKTGFPRQVNGDLLTADELAANEAIAVKIMDKRRSR